MNDLWINLDFVNFQKKVFFLFYQIKCRFWKNCSVQQYMLLGVQGDGFLMIYIIEYYSFFKVYVLFDKIKRIFFFENQ